MKLAPVIAACAVVLAACSGVEELALNPQGSGAGNAGASAAGSATDASGGGGASSLAGSAGSAVTPGGGAPSMAGHGGAAGRSSMPTGGTNPVVACLSGISCPDASPFCRADGKCVACLNDAQCGGEDAQCELVGGTCITPDCAAGTGGEAGSDCSAP